MQMLNMGVKKLLQKFLNLSLVAAVLFTLVAPVGASAATLPTLISPVPGSQLTSTTATFSWTPVSGATEYRLALGNTQAGPEIAWREQLSTPTVTITGLPKDGRNICVRTFAVVNGVEIADDTYVVAYKDPSTTYTPTTSCKTDLPTTTVNPPATTSPTVYVAPKLTDPANYSTLTATTATLNWNDVKANSYIVYVGNVKGGKNYFSKSGLTTRSVTVSGLPTDGSKIYVRLWAKFGTKLYGRDQILYATKTVAPTQPAPTQPAPTEPAPAPIGNSTLTAVWANDGGDKVTQNEKRATASATAVKNSVWDGTKINVFGAKNEVVAFNTILETGSNGSKGVSVKFDTLTGPGGATISSAYASGNGVFDYTKRDIENFYVRYLQIKGLSKLSYEQYDERHIPKKMQRPFTGEGYGSGNWYSRPNADKYYPEIAQPLETKSTFDIAANQNQSIWTDIYIPKTAVNGLYKGNVEISENGVLTKVVPVELTVKNFTLPETPTAKTMVFISRENINQRYLGNTSDGLTSKKIRDEHFKMAHRHKISLIDFENAYNDRPSDEWVPRLNGSLFTSANGYRGPGVNTGNNVYSIGTYGNWWDEEGEAGMRTHSNNWVNWFNANAPSTEYFLYLIDESGDYPLIQKWASWIQNNPGVGKALMSFVTAPIPSAIANAPALDIAASWITVGDKWTWDNALSKVDADSSKRAYMYNGKRPANGSFATEDDGVALRQLPWAQYKKGVDRWFFWEGTYYNNYQGGTGQTNVFKSAHTFGGSTGFDNILGQTGWNYSNGDGVLFYPGTDKVYTSESLGLNGPLASLRLKHWRRGIQDTDYLALANAKNPTAVNQIIAQMVPKVLWDYGVSDSNDPTWVRTDISWSTNPDVWETARAQLANIIETGSI